MKLYDTVYYLLVIYPELRNSDKKLLWAVYIRKGLVRVSKTNRLLSQIMYMDYMNAPSAESVTRARRKVQEKHPELNATSSVVRQKRQQKQDSRGTFIYRENI